MSTKKKLITRMALSAGAVLVGALLVGGTALLAAHADRQRWEDAQKAARQQVVERSRKYLAEIAKRIDKLPVDPTLVGEIESRYFEERPSGPMRVWAMGTGGEFLFGVPRESFSRLNAVYDREITPRLKEGVFLDRQSFFLGHFEEGGDLVLPEDLIHDEGEREVWGQLRRYADRSEGAFVLSAPLKTAEGAALGSLYLKREVPDPESYHPDDRAEVVAGAAGAVAVLAVIFLWVLLPTWVYVDGTERGFRRARLFAFLTVISSLIGLVVYLISRPEEGKTLVCPGCGREVNGGAFCPHCGRDLSASFCATCRYPLKPDWAFCPSCRTEIKAPATTPTEAPAAT
ncbi:MAG TPA: zinc ribbon domain-containing protein [Vicinamibacteria bacterium]|nr:zinc ribbon domain-containing protein [Vicinamibacteria bacterium]